MAGPRLNLVDPDLVSVVQDALAGFEGGGRIFSGYRTAAEQRELYATGRSPVLHSQHMLGLAVDVVLYDPTERKKVADWSFERYRDFNRCVQMFAAAKGITVTWGGDWRSRDGVHFQIEGREPFAVDGVPYRSTAGTKTEP
jgi:peptidoglycan L-alanyl-D-glutamate endopeptidase CwlK